MAQDQYVGYRTKKRLDKKNKKRKFSKWLVALAIVIAVFLLLGVFLKVSPFDEAWDKTADGFAWLGRHVRPFKTSKKAVAADFLPEGKKTASYLLAITKQEEGATVLTTVVLMSYDSSDGSGSLVFFPADLLVNAPGMGSDQLTNLVELNGGRVSSTLVTIENILGIEVDKYILATDRDLRIILKQFGDKLPVDVGSRISFKDTSLGVTLDLKPGRQNLSPDLLTAYLTCASLGKELDLAKRQVAFAPVFMAMMRGVDMDKFMRTNANLFDTDASNKELAGMSNACVSLKGKKLRAGIVPVREFRFEKTIVHRLDKGALPAFIKKYAKSASTAALSRRFKIEILNGCGVPGIGQKVSPQIDLAKFQIVNSANADTFEHPETIIIVYSDKKEIIAAAEELRNELEVGKLESHLTVESMSDISVIVGKDYVNK
ncbi:MAG: hypothetical protein CVT63_05570 [Candidatus Anoxymicrobium japonicum]|uniref:LytR family transcriptional regulator n=1 Tax=Candidatus Anoxymicrobium japonicum TaxID=2013648 RepID=A0A2N3G5A3_9ACTN|nr:MAG: hypothetical protein CVT63_05570 [Candidatus Anoxymicrobium japonicum]